MAQFPACQYLVHSRVWLSDREAAFRATRDHVAFVITLLALAVGTICWGLKVQKQLPWCSPEPGLLLTNMTLSKKPKIAPCCALIPYDCIEGLLIEKALSSSCSYFLDNQLQSLLFCWTAIFQSMHVFLRYFTKMQLVTRSPKRPALLWCWKKDAPPHTEL